MNDSNESAKGRKRGGRPEQPLEVEIEFIDDGKASERWDKIFELLECETTWRSERLNDVSGGSEFDQLSLF